MLTAGFYQESQIGTGHIVSGKIGGNIGLLNDLTNLADDELTLFRGAHAGVFREDTITETCKPILAGVCVQLHYGGEQNCVGHTVGNVEFAAQGIR